MKALPLITCLLLCFASQAFSQSSIRGLPAGAVVLETRKVPGAKHPDRALVLWMLSPKRNPSGYEPDEVYPCPDQTRGSYYSGPTRVSLLNSATRTIINTVKIAEESEEGADTFDVPYAIRKGYYYRVETQAKTGVEAKPTIMCDRGLETFKQSHAMG